MRKTVPKARRAMLSCTACPPTTDLLTPLYVTLPNKLPQREATVLARHLDVAYKGRKMDELRENLRDQWPSSMTDGGAVSFPAITLHVPLDQPSRYRI